MRKFLLISRGLELNCIASVYHFLFQVSLGTPLCVVQFQHNLVILQYVRTCPKYSVASGTFLQVCHSPTHPFVGLLVRAACSLQSLSTDCQHTHSRNAKTKHYHHPDVSPQRVIFPPIWRQQQVFIGAVKLSVKNLLASTSFSSSQAHFSYWHNFSSVVRAQDRTIRRSPSSLHLEIVHNPCTVSYHPSSQPSASDPVQLLSCTSMRRLFEMREAVPELSKFARSPRPKLPFEPFGVAVTIRLVD